MQRLEKNILLKYSTLLKILLFIFLFGVLSFGRAFSVIHINIHNFPVFITEPFLLFSFPLLLIYFKDLFKLPKIFLIVTSIYFLFGIIYLCIGGLEGNFFAYRDFMVLCGYMLFLPLTFICFQKRQAIGLFVGIIIAADIITILTGKILISGFNGFWLYDFVFQAKIYQVGIIYGFGSIFLMVFYNYFKNRVLKLLALSLTSVNLYMFIIFGVRSLWVAFVCLVLFLLPILGFKNAVKLYVKFFAAFIIIGTILFYIDSVTLKFPQFNILKGKTKSLAYFLVKPSDKSIHFGNGARISSEKKFEKIGYDNIIWRAKIWKQTIHFTSGAYSFGRGFGNYPHYDIWGYQEPSTPFADSRIIPTHNHLLTIFYKMGLFGLSLFLFINIYAFYYGFKYLKKSQDMFLSLFIKGGLGALLFWNITALFFDVIDSPPTSILLWIFIGFIFAVVKIDKELEVI